jgi:hypothetical protein
VSDAEFGNAPAAFLRGRFCRPTWNFSKSWIFW